MGSTSKKRRSTKSLGAVAATENGDLGPSGAERRKHTRVYLFGGRIEVSKINGAKRELRTPLVNISSGGLFIRFVNPARRFLFFKTKPVVDTEDLVHFNLFLPPNYDPIPICGRVVRYERIDKTQVGVGIEFSAEYTTDRSLERIERAIRTPVRNSERAKQIEDKRLRYSERLRAAHFEKNGEVINASQIIISSKKKRSKTKTTRRRNTTEALADAPSLLQEDGQEPAPKAKRPVKRAATERIQRLRRTSAAELSMQPVEEEKARSKKRASSKKRRKAAASSSSIIKTEAKEASSARGSKSRSKKSVRSGSESSTTKSTKKASKSASAKSSSKASSKPASKSASKVSASSELKRVKKSEGRRSSRTSEAKRARDSKRSSAEPRKKKRAEDGASRKKRSASKPSSASKSESRPRTKRKRRESSEANEPKKKRSRSRPAHAERAHQDPSPTRRFVNTAELHDTDIVPGDPTRTSSGRKRRPSGRRPLRARSMRTQVLTVSSDVVVADSDLI